jgi:hypothetical protein
VDAAQFTGNGFLDDEHGAPVFVGRSAVLRHTPRVLVAAAVLPIVFGQAALALFLLTPVVIIWLLLPWQFALFNDGIVLWFGLGRSTFLPKDVVAVRASLAAPVVLPRVTGRVGFPVPGADSTLRRRELRGQLVARGYCVAS